MKRTVEVDRDLALIGAAAKLRELAAEMTKLYSLFPELRRGSRLKTRGVSGRTYSTISEANRRKMSAGMKKYWARRKAATKKAAKAAKTHAHA